MLTTDMAQNLPLFALFLLCPAAQVSADLVSANVGDNVTLTASSECRTGGDFRLVTGDNTLTVARRVNGDWQPGGPYEGRIQHRSATSVLLLRVNYNDEGHFEFFCGADAGPPIELQVLILSKVSSREGETVQLPCHVQTRGGTAKSFTWERDGKPVLEHDPSSKVSRPGAGFEGRVSATPDWELRGDLSLTLKEAHLQDEGVFSCYVEDKDGKRRRGNPAAAKLEVLRCTRDQTTPPPVPSTPDIREDMGPGAVTGLVLAFAVGGFVLGWFLRQVYTRRSSGSRAEQNPDVTRPLDEKVNGH